MRKVGNELLGTVFPSFDFIAWVGWAQDKEQEKQSLSHGD